ncbi:ParB/RepB/Spo0J family partition protein [Limibacillus halophilus]|uniref:ParB family chromosome partitioning protein n=1 Tax=Limibacillus halophilus TaxID=1579333 RepID=A0A839SNJ5_9PROT|nr:ParB/RepB/Spo0J family partition protein [Limibacillus halophilus]MBB3064022.1 ParB family chromosome partitioning protein [Limibacillus halophilus]
MAQTPKKRGLGRGLAALFNEEGAESAVREAEAAEPKKSSKKGASAAPASTPRTGQLVPVEHLEASPFQPRHNFDEDALDALAQSIKENGLLQPILVRPHATKKNRFEIVAGERRWRAAQRAQLHEVPVIQRDFDDAQTLEIAIVENVQRQDLNAIEEAEGYRRLQSDFGNSQEAIARVVGKSRSHIANALRLLSLPNAVKGMIEEGTISAGHARALIGAPDPLAIAKRIASQGLSVRETERLAQAIKQPGKTLKKVRSAVEKDADTIELERELQAALGLKVSINHKGEAGDLVLHYTTLEQLDDLIARLQRPGR